MKDMIENGYAEKATDDDNLKPDMTSTSITMEQDIQKRKKN